jgi:hypothetical protein
MKSLKLRRVDAFQAWTATLEAQAGGGRRILYSRRPNPLAMGLLVCPGPQKNAY